MTKVVRIYLTYDDEEKLPYKDLCKHLFEAQKEVRKIKNKAIQLCWENENRRNDYKRCYGSYPKDTDLYGRPFRTYLYQCLSKEGDILQKGNLVSALEEGRKRYENSKKDVYIGKESIPSFKSDQPIRLGNKSIKLSIVNGQYGMTLSLFSNKYLELNKFTSGRFDFTIHTRGKFQKDIINKCIDGKYKVSESQLCFDKRKKQWYLDLSFSFEKEQKNSSDKNNVMGIDLGIVYVAYMSYNNSDDSSFIEGGEIEVFRQQIKDRKRSLQFQGRYCSKGRIGHGVKTRIKPVLNLSDKEARFRDTANHKYSRYIVNEAIKHNCGIIQMEDLSGITSKSNKFLKNWPYYDLQSKIEYKAKEAGIEVIKVDPKYTSQRCSKCGYIDKDNRKTQSEFECLSCGYKANADYNASKNIATPNIDKIIKIVMDANVKLT